MAADYRRADSSGNVEPIDEAKYIRKTKRKCPVCAKSTPLYLKLQDLTTGSSVLECKSCWNTVMVPYGTEDVGP